MRFKISKWINSLKIKGFIRQVFSIILGLSITLGAGQVVKSIEREREIKESLRMVRHEMETSMLDFVKECDEVLAEHKAGYKFMRENKYDFRKFPVDTVKEYYFKATVFFAEKGDLFALGILRGTSVFESIDKDLVMKIVEAYDQVTQLRKYVHGRYGTMITENLDKFIFENFITENVDGYDIVEKYIQTNFAKNRMYYSGEMDIFKELIDNTITQINETIALINERIGETVNNPSKE